MIKKFKTIFVLLGVFLSSCNAQKEEAHLVSSLRAPAYPLVTIDPNTSAWSYTDNLYDESVKHWTGRNFPLLGVIKVDGQLYRFMGKEEVELLSLAPMGDNLAWNARYITAAPNANWNTLDFDDTGWRDGKAPFGTKVNEPRTVTNWEDEKIWVRREIVLEEDLIGKNVYLEFTHDDDATLYVNGMEVVNTGNKTGKNTKIKLSDEVVKTLKKGKNLLAGYCHNRVANGFFDFGLFKEKEGQTFFANTAKQTSADVQATQTHYTFTCGPVELKVTFTAPMFLDNLELMSRPVNYLTYEVKASDKQEHQVEIYFEASPNWALDSPLQESTTEAFEDNNLVFLKTGSKSQDILGKKGDDLRIDWGYFYMVADKQNTTYQIGESSAVRASFIKNSEAAVEKGTGKNQLSLTKKVTLKNGYTDKIMLGYDDVFSIQYFGENLRPYWNAEGKSSILEAFHKSYDQYNDLIAKSTVFDHKLMSDFSEEGGQAYAELCALAYRQAIAAHKLVKAPNGDLLLLSKENDSNGSIGTVDVTYPSAPLFLYYNPELAKALMNFIFYYSESGKWTKPFAAHDVGTYPLANGQTYGGDMPVEESGNMLILTHAIAKMEGDAAYAKKHWSVLTTWADYLVENGLDPENQLCTDDFAGHFAHNANLSIKAILGIASYGKLAGMLGETKVADKYVAIAREMAKEWKRMAKDGDHYKLTFDKSNTWSQKYNLVWDKIFDMDIFDADIAQDEIAYYLTKQNVYGLPLDSRETYTKSDWIFWTATLAPDVETFKKFISPVHRFMHETTDRVPMSDWIYTDKANRRGFKARSVVGGYFIKMLESKVK